MSKVVREADLGPVVPPFDSTVLFLSELDKEFLRDIIIEDDENLKARILEIQKVAYAKHPYPCIHAFHFVNLMMVLNPAYPRVLEESKKRDTLLLDLGCCMGTDVRKLVRDGYPPTHVFGCDLRQEFINCGYQLFNDRNKCQATFFVDDIFGLPYPLPPCLRLPLSSQPQTLASLVGRLTHIYAGALFHLFDESTQYGLALRLATILKREEGAVIFGRHQGLEKEGVFGDDLQRTRYGHSVDSWSVLWHRVFSEVESLPFADEHVHTDTVLVDGFRGEDMYGPILGASKCVLMLYWSVRIV